MASKRTFDEEDHQNNDDRDLQIRPKRRHGDPQEAEATHLSFLIASHLVPVVRNVIKEEISSVLQGYSCLCNCRLSLNQQGGTSGGRAMQLCFVNTLPPEIFTMANIKAENGNPLQIELRYAASQQRVVTSTTMKVQICVLDGDFGKDGNEEWTAGEFNAQTVKPREGKGQLLKGDTVIKLENGVASINNIMFTDNSCGTRNRTVRLGVKIVQSNSVGTDIREGRSEAFKVKDKRGESYRKHDRPSLNDEVWRLKNIGKGGKLHRQLSSNGIKTVKDLLRLNTIGSLREKFGKVNRWDKIIAHAKDCEIDAYERYIYEHHATEQFIPISLVFNCIYQVVEVIFYGQHPRPLQSLNLEEKRLVERVKQEAYKNLQDLKKLTQEPSYTAPDPDPDLPQLCCLLAQQGPLVTWPSTLTSIIDESANNGLVGYDQVRGKAPLNLSAEAQVVPEGAYINNIDDGNGWAVGVPQIGQFGSYQWDQHQLDLYSFPYGDDGASCSINPPIFPNTAECIPSLGKTLWHKIRNALKSLIPHMA